MSCCAEDDRAESREAADCVSALLIEAASVGCKLLSLLLWRWKIGWVNLTRTVCGTWAKCSWSRRYAATSRMAASPTLTVGFKPGSPRARPTKPYIPSNSELTCTCCTMSTGEQSEQQTDLDVAWKHTEKLPLQVAVVLAIPMHNR